MKTNKLNVILVIIIVIFAGLLGYILATKKADKEKTELFVQQKEKEIKILEETTSELKKTISNYDKEVAKLNESVGKLKNDIGKKEDELEKTKEKLKEMPSEHLVKEAQRILNTKEIWLSGEKVEFSLNAFRANAESLVEWEEYKFTLIPKYKQTIDEQEKQILKLNGKDILHVQLETTLENKNNALEEENQELKIYIAKREAKDKFSKILWIAGSIGVGYLLGNVLGK